MGANRLSKNSTYKSAREKFLELSLESSRKSYYPQLQTNLEILKNNTRRLQLLADNLPARISHIDAEERYLFVNREYKKAFGMTRARIEGREIAPIIGKKSYDKELPYIQKVLSGEQVCLRIVFPTGMAILSGWES